MVSIYSFGITSAIVLILVSFLNFVGNYNTLTIQTVFSHLNCPMPSNSGLWGNGNDTNGNSILMHQNGTYNYPNVNNKTLTLKANGIICSQVHTINGLDYYWGSVNSQIFGITINTGIPFAGMPFFVGDYLAEVGDKIANFFYMVGVIMNPANFVILGYTTSQMMPLGQIVVFALFIVCYIGVGAMVYKIISPLAGGG